MLYDQETEAGHKERSGPPADLGQMFLTDEGSHLIAGVARVPHRDCPVHGNKQTSENCTTNQPVATSYVIFFPFEVPIIGAQYETMNKGDTHYFHHAIMLQRQTVVHTVDRYTVTPGVHELPKERPTVLSN